MQKSMLQQNLMIIENEYRKSEDIRKIVRKARVISKDKAGFGRVGVIL